MLSIKNLEKFINQEQTSGGNVVREYFQHLFLSYLYKQPGSERLLFKGGTALRIIFKSPRYSEDLDFTGINITAKEIEGIFVNVLAELECVGIEVELIEGKPTTGGFLGIAQFRGYDRTIAIQIEVSLRKGKSTSAVRTVIENDYIPSYTLVHLSIEEIVKGKLEALFNRHKPRDFYDYFFLLSVNYPLVKDTDTLKNVAQLLKSTQVDFRMELKRFLPHSHSMHLKNFRKLVMEKISSLL